MRPPAVRFHPEAVSVGLRRLGVTFQPHEYAELLAQVNRAVREVASSQGVPQRDMDPPYLGWRRKTFHSKLHPPQHFSADMRLIYQFSDDGAMLQILAVGRRLPGEPGDIYAATTSRSHAFLGCARWAHRGFSDLAPRSNGREKGISGRVQWGAGYPR